MLPFLIKQQKDDVLSRRYKNRNYSVLGTMLFVINTWLTLLMTSPGKFYYYLNTCFIAGASEMSQVTYPVTELAS